MEAAIQSISTGIIILAGGIGLLIFGMFMLGSKQGTIDKKLDKILKHLGIEEGKEYDPEAELEQEWNEGDENW